MKKRHHKLKGNEELFGILMWQRLLHSLAEGEVAEGKFTVKRTGFIHPKVTAISDPLNEEIAVMSINLSRNGDLVFANGGKFNFRARNL